MSSDPLADAVRLAQAGRLPEAARLCEQMLQQRPMHAPTLMLAGLIALRSGDAATAVKRLSNAAALDARNPAAHANLGDALGAAGRLADAVAAYRRALAIDPRLAAAQAGLGLALQEQGDTAGALAAFEKAASLDRNSPAILSNLGAALHAAGRLDEALTTLNRARTLAPGHPEPLYNTGVVLQAKADFAGAERCYREALAAAPQHVPALHNLGFILAAQGRHEAALPLYERVLALAPGYTEALFNHANALKDLGRFADAIAGYDRVVLRDAAHRGAQENRGLAWLTSGDLTRGWYGYLWRAVPRERTPRPQEKLPDDLSGRTIFLRCEQGLGDELFFLRFVPLLAARGARVVSEADPRLLSIVARHPGISAAVPRGDDPGPYDIEAFQGDVPCLLGSTTFADAPPAAIAPDAARVNAWRQRLAAAGPPPYVAVSWRAGVLKDGRFTKVTPVAELGRAVAAAHGTIVIAQRNPQAEEIEALKAALGRVPVDLSTANSDLEDVLALMALVDTYVAVSNTNVHLRAAAGRPSHVLVPFPPEWRWGAAGDEHPWFPATRLYRQSAGGDWQAACAALARDLAR